MLDWINKENINAKDYASTYKGESVMYEGIATYKDESVFLSKNTLKKCMPNLKGCPVIIEHKLGIKPDNMEKYAVGYVTDCEYNNETGDFDCDFVTWNDEAKELLKNGYTLSTSYIPKKFGNGGTFINTPYDKEIKDLRFTHLAIVKNPRYEKVKVYMNSTEKLNDKWITKFDKEGEPYHVNIDPTDDKKGKYKWKDKDYTISQLIDEGFEPIEYTTSLFKDTPLTWLHKQEGKKEYRLPLDSKAYKEALKVKQDKKAKELQEARKESKALIDYIKWQTNTNIEPYITRKAGNKIIIDWDKLPNMAKSNLKILERDKKLNLDQFSGREKSIEFTKLKGKKSENQNDINEEKENYCMDKIEVEQGFLKSLLDRVSKTLEFSNADDEEEKKLAAEKAAKEAEEKAKAEEEAKKKAEEEAKAKEEAEKAAKEKENSVDWFEKMQEVMNSNDRGEADKIKPSPNAKSALEKGKKIFG